MPFTWGWFRPEISVKLGASMEDTFELYRKMYRIPESIYKRNVECFTELLGMEEF